MLNLRYPIGDATYQDYELNLMMVLAAIKRGSSEPLPWLLALEGLL